METEERPAKFRKLEATTDLETSGEHVTSDIPDAGLQIEQEEENLPDSQTEDASKDDDGIGGSNLEQPTLTKSAMKKLRRRQQWEADRDLRKIKRKEKQVAKRERLKLEKAELATARANGQVIDDTAQAPAQKPLSVPLTFLVDCGFDEQMLDKEIVSISTQIVRCYAQNRKALYQPSLAISSFGGRLETRFSNVMQKPQARWRSVHIENDDFVAVAEKAKQWMREEKSFGLKECPALKSNADALPDSGEVVYLTADSDEILEELKPYSLYIIGGIVDRNRHKGICYKRAMARGIKTAKLPIGEYMQMNSRFVLATNHVYEIMLKWLELKDWGGAFMHVIPKRKGGILKGVEAANDDQEGEVDTSDDGSEADVGVSTEASL